MERELVQLVGSNAEKCSHLIYEGSRAACAGAVHTLFNAAGKEYYLCVLAAQLYNCVGIRLLLLYREESCVYLLNEGNVCGIGKSETCRARNADREFLIRIVRLYYFKLIRDRFLDL